jgi:glutathione synthase
MFRSDYMIHADPSEKNPTPEIKQVEFNTIASSFGGLSSAVTKLHQYSPKALPIGSYDRYLYSIGAYGEDTPISTSGLPDNPAAASLAAGLAAAHKTYGNPTAKVLFLVQEPERNIFDQRWIEYHLQETHGVQSRRITLSALGDWGKLDHERRLLVPSARGEGEDEVSVVYLRAGYDPKDYDGEREWGARRMMELSKAIKCPTVITQLAGCKKVQQVLAAPGILERYQPQTPFPLLTR